MRQIFISNGAPAPPGAEPVLLGDVLYLERVLRKTVVVRSCGTSLTTQTPQDLLREIADRFIRCHQSYWVNADAVVRVEAGMFLLKNGEQIPISRTYRRAAKEQFFRFLSNPS